ncbi:MAG: SNF2-related protein [Eubacteriales bacterium]
MTEKEQKIQEARKLFYDTKDKVTRNPENWQEFLKTGSRTYKYPLRDQIMIHAQKPDVTACASFEVWSKTLDRKISKGSKGIALLHNDKNDNLRVNYVYDISDTETRQNSKTGFLWEMKQDYQGAIQDSMTAHFGEVSTNHFESMLMNWSEKAVEEHIPNIIDNLKFSIEGSLLEEIDEKNLDMTIKRALTSSVQFSVLTRCGFDPSEHLENEDFNDVFDFNTNNVFGILGQAIADVNCDLLNQIGDIARSVEMGVYKKNLEQKLEKTQNDLDNQKDTVYDIVEELEPNMDIITGKEDKVHERDSNSELNGGGGLHSRVRTGTSALGNRGGGERTSGNVGRETSGLPEKPQAAPVSNNEFQHDPNGTSLRDRQASRRDGGLVDGTNDESRGSDGGSETSRPSALGEIVQQRDGESERNRTERPDLRLNDTEVEETPEKFQQTSLFDISKTGAEEQVSSAPNSISTEKRIITIADFEKVLAHGTGEVGSKERIAEFLGNPVYSKGEKAEFLKNEYGVQDIKVDQYHVRTREHYGMALEIPEETKSKALPFHQLANIIDNMMERGEYLKEEERPKSEPVATVENPEETTPQVLFFENFDDMNLDYSQYQDGDLIGYDINGVKFELGEIDGHYFTTTTTAIAPNGQVLGHAMSQENYEKFKAWKEELAQDKAVMTPEVEHSVEIPEKGHNTILWEKYQELQRENPSDLVIIQNGGFFEVQGEKVSQLPTDLEVTPLFRDCDGEQVAIYGFPHHILEDYQAYLNEVGFDLTVATVSSNKEFSVERFENTAPELTAEEVQTEVATIEKSPETIFWEQYKELQAENPNDLVLYQNKAFYEIMGENTRKLPEELHDKISHRVCDGEEVPVFSFIEHQILDYVEYFKEEGFSITEVDVKGNGDKFTQRFSSGTDLNEKNHENDRIQEILTINEAAFNPRSPDSNPLEIEYLAREPKGASSVNTIFQQFTNEELKTALETMGVEIEIPVDKNSDFPFKTGDIVSIDDIKYQISRIFEDSVRYSNPTLGSFHLEDDKSSFLEKVLGNTEKSPVVPEKELPPTLEKGLEFSMDGMDYIVDSVSDLTGTVYLQDKNSSINSLEMADKSAILEHLQGGNNHESKNVVDFPFQEGDIIDLTDERTYIISTIDLENREIYLSDRSEGHRLPFQRIYSFEEFQEELVKQSPELHETQEEYKSEVPISERIPVGLGVDIDNANFIVESVNEKTGYVIFNDQAMIDIGMNSVLKTQIEIPRVLQHLEMVEREELEQIYDTPTVPEPEIPDFPFQNGDVVELGNDLKYSVLSVSEDDILLRSHAMTMGDNTLTLDKEKFLELVEKQQGKEELAKTLVEPVKTEKSTSETLYEAFQNSAEPNWQENAQKQRKIQGAFHKILDDETQTKDLFALVQEIEPKNQFEFDRIYHVIAENQGKEQATEQPSGEFAVGDVVELGGTKYKVRQVEGDEIQLNNSISSPPLTFTKEELQERLQEQGDLQARKERNLQDIEKIPLEKVIESKANEQVVPTTAESTSQSAPRTDITEEKGENFKISNTELGHGTGKEKCHRNILAIQTLHQIESEKRTATPEEQEILSNYVGWGGLQEAFDENKSAWASEFTTLKGLLPEKDYAQAKRTVLDSFYTAPEIIESMYKALEKMGVPKDVQILEPSLGVGNFIGMKSEYFSEAKVSGSELDSISGRIAKQLYPEADIQVKGFEKTDFYDESFDVAIGNVPFGDFHVNDPKYNDQKLQVHDYFFAKSLDQVKDGGIVAFITSSGTMDKKNSTFREKLSKNADLLGAIRLPNTAFKENAGTEVTSDIIFLQKRSELQEVIPNWVKTGETKDGIPMNQYFIDNPDMIMGHIEMQSSRFGPAPVCVPDSKTTLKEQLSSAIAKLKKPVMELLEKIVVKKKSVEEQSKGERIFGMELPETARNFSYFLKDDTIYFKDNDKIFKPEVKKSHEPRIKSMIAIADQTRKVIDLQLEQCSDEVLTKEQGVLNKLHDDFHNTHKEFAWTGNKSAFKEDISYPLLCSLQNLDDDKKLISKADIFSKRTVRQTEKITAVNSPVEALGVCIGEKAKVDIPFMEQLLQGKMDSKEIIASLEGIIFKNPLSDMSNPFDGWENADEYLSGNVRDKLAIAEKMMRIYPELSNNVEKLQEVQPTKLKATEIDVRIGSTWIDPKFYKQFMFETFNTPESLKNIAIDIVYDKVHNEWNVKGKSVHQKGAMLEKYGTKRKNPYQLLEDSLNLRDTKVNDKVDDTYVFNPVETAKARNKQEIIGEKFQEWLWKDMNRHDELVETYNQIYNSIRPREFDGSHIQFDGMTDQVELKQHQKNAVARTLYGENTLLAHAVGAGKTYTMIASAMEGKRLGLHNKSMIAVPKHLVVQMGADVSKLYPSAKVLVAGEDDFTPAKREEFCSRVATGDFDVVVLGHTQFSALQFSPEIEEKILNKQIEELTASLLECKGNDGAKFTVKKLERTREKVKTKLEKLKNANTPSVESIYFDKMGVDKIFIDEAHIFKNLPVHSKMQNVAGVASGESARATDMLAKCQYISEQTNGKGVVFATGTPVSNSMSELFVMMKFLQENTLKKMGLNHFDSWASSFGEKVTSLELAPEGEGFRQKTRFAKFFNLPELVNIWKLATDIQTADMLNLPVPKVIPHIITSEASEFQKEMILDLADRAEVVRDKRVDPSEDNLLKITGEGRKLALDQRLQNPDLPDDPNSKINKVVENVHRIYGESNDKLGTQMIFCDQSTPKGDGEFNVYDDMRDKLVKMGIPKKEIAFIHEHDSDEKKAKLFKNIREGKVRVLLGSTEKMGSGTNCQTKLIALHHVDCPWKPSSIERASVMGIIINLLVA